MKSRSQNGSVYHTEGADSREVMDRNISFPDYITQQYLRLLVTILFSSFTAAVFLYPERFSFLRYPFSSLGSRYSPSGIPNTYSRMIFDLAMIFSSYTMYLLASYHRNRHPVPASSFYEFLSYLSAAGFLLMLVPCDSSEIRFVHSLGSAFVVGSHFIATLCRFAAVHQHVSKVVFSILLGTLIFFVLLYAFVWFMQYTVHPLLQKPAFIAIIGTELYGSSVSRKFGEHRIFGLLQNQHMH